MKKALLVLGLFILSVNISAQDMNNLSVELDLARYAPETGLFGSQYYPNQFSFVNGFNIGYRKSDKFQYLAGIRRINSKTNSGDGFNYESTEKNGMEYRLGARISTGTHRNVFLSFGLDLFGEFSCLQGAYWVDYPPSYEINHSKNYIGIAPSLLLNFKLSERVLLFIQTRYRFGRVMLVHKESTLKNYELYPTRSYWSGVYDPANSIGMRFNF